MSRITPGDCGRVAVVMGGRSSERAVSLDSGAGVLAALRERQVDAFAVDGIGGLIAAIHAGQVDRVFNILHGRDGEDGVLAGLCTAYELPFTGSGLLASALTLDKVQCKRLFDAEGLPTCPWRAVADEAAAESALGELGLPLIAKPVAEGSTVGVIRITAEVELLPAFRETRKHGPVLLERLVDGHELTVGILGRQALPPIRIVPAGGFYDYHAKYQAEDTAYLIPTGLGEALEAEIATLSLRAFDLTGCSGWGRVDLMVDRGGRPWLLEINTTPGMTSHSLVPKAAAAVGIDYPDLCWRILLSSFPEDAR